MRATIIICLYSSTTIYYGESISHREDPEDKNEQTSHSMISINQGEVYLRGLTVGVSIGLTVGVGLITGIEVGVTVGVG